MDLLILLGGLSLCLLAGGTGFLLGRFVWPVKHGVDPAAYALAQNEIARGDQECKALRARAEQLDVQCSAVAEQARSSGEEVARLGERIASLTRQIEEQTALLQKIETEKNHAASQATEGREQVARLTEREKALTETIATQTKQLGEMHKQLTTEFENIANRILKINAAELSESSQKALAATLEPFRDRMQEFQKKVETAYAAETREVLSLKEHIKLVVETSHAIGSQADGLAKALRGDSQLLGRWGELALERILEAAGLQEGREYITQGRGLKLKSNEGGLQRPDVIVLLPEERSMIIDSKTPLARYERLITTRDEDERDTLRHDFVSDIKGHIDSLAGKRYQENSALRAHDCVLMFVPIEGALAAALTSEPELFTYAWDRHVVLAGPPTLLMTLRTVASIWRYQQQGENAQEIARLAGELCDKISNSIGDLNGIAEKMHAALGAHSDAMKRLFTGRGNALTLGDRIKGLGVKAKPTPNVIIDGRPLVFASSEDEDCDTEAESASKPVAPAET
ncbi:MAG: DNA recombination protein RmuC [Beijerinckiaceae bacterium]